GCTFRARTRWSASCRGSTCCEGRPPVRRYAAPVNSADGDRGRRARWGSYRSLAERLRARIDAGDLAPGERLPGEHALAAEYGVSRATARAACAHLEAAGRVVAVQGR